MNSYLVEIEDVSYRYGKRVVLENVSLKLEPGTFVALMGKSGSGKSTLLYILGGFLKPWKGVYRFAGEKVYRIGEWGLGRFRRRNVGFLFQDFRLLSFLTVEQNVKFPILFSGKRIKRGEVRELLKLLGIDHRRKAYPRDISGGEAQRTALARALVMDPQLLLLDEPTGNLDEETEAEILEHLQKLKQQGLCLICVTHSPRIAKSADRTVRIENGRLHDEKGGSKPDKSGASARNRRKSKAKKKEAE